MANRAVADLCRVIADCRFRGASCCIACDRVVGFRAGALPLLAWTAWPKKGTRASGIGMDQRTGRSLSRSRAKAVQAAGSQQIAEYPRAGRSGIGKGL